MYVLNILLIVSGFSKCTRCNYSICRFGSAVIMYFFLSVYLRPSCFSGDFKIFSIIAYQVCRGILHWSDCFVLSTVNHFARLTIESVSFNKLENETHVLNSGLHAFHFLLNASIIFLRRSIPAAIFANTLIFTFV